MTSRYVFIFDFTNDNNLLVLSKYLKLNLISRPTDYFHFFVSWKGLTTGFFFIHVHTALSILVGLPSSSCLISGMCANRTCVHIRTHVIYTMNNLLTNANSNLIKYLYAYNSLRQKNTFICTLNYVKNIKRSNRRRVRLISILFRKSCIFFSFFLLCLLYYYY